MKIKTIIIWVFFLTKHNFLYAQVVEYKIDKTEKKYLNLYFQAEAYKLTEDYENALVFYEKCIALNPEESSAHSEIAKIYFSSQAWNNSEYYIREAIKLDPTNKWYYYLLIDVYVVQNKVLEQLETYSDLIKLDPQNQRYYLQKLYVLKELGLHKKAIKFINKIESVFGTSNELLIEKKGVYVDGGNFLEAEKIIKRLIKEAPKNTKYYSELASLYMQFSKYEKAISTYNKLLEINPNNPAAILALYKIYNNKGDQLNQEKYLLMVTENPIISLETKRELFYRLLKNNTNGAQDALKQIVIKAISIYPEEALFNLILGDISAKELEYQEAINYYKKSLRSTFVKDEYVYNKLIEIYFVQKDYSSVVKTAHTALEKYPFSARFYYYQGLALFNQKELDLALKSLLNGVDLVIDNPNFKSDFYALVGDIYHDLKNYNSSDESYEKALAHNNKNVFVLNNYSYYLSLRGLKLDLAKEMAEKCNELTVSSPTASFLDTYAWVLYKLKEYELAKAQIEKATALDDSSVTLFDHYGDILNALGDTVGALEKWKKALFLDPNNIQIKEKLKEYE